MISSWGRSSITPTSPSLIETILPIALFLALREARESYTFLGISAVLLTSLVVSASRGGLIGFVEVLGVLFLSHVQKPTAGRRIGSLALVLAAVTAILTLIVGFETASARFASGALTSGRLQFAISTLHMIAARPWIGWGLGSWPAVYPAFATFDPGAIVNQAHCDWLQWTAEGGLPVGFAMLSLAVWAIQAGDSIDLGNRRDRRLDPCVVRLPVFASGALGHGRF